MNIGIITFHFVPNQGAVLQCYALQQFVEKHGHNASIIDYRPQYHTIRYDAVKNPFLYSMWFWKRNHNKSTVKRLLLSGRIFLKCIYMNVKKADKDIQDSFETFINKTLHLTKRYTSLKELRNDPPCMDAYISGSDQLWNPELLNQDFDGAYFLEFGEADIPRIAYAVSIGKEQDEHFQREIQRHCSKLTAVSLREYDERIIQSIGRDVHICIDPTLLLDAGDYECIESDKKEEEPYIFVYGFETTEEMKRAVDMAAQKYGCRVINGSPQRVKLDCECDIRKEFCPDEFLSYIKNAKCVVTNSFHATTFSIIYKKDFITVAHSTRGLRMRELLGKLGLNCCLWGNEAFNFNCKIDWEDVSKRICVFRNHSEEFLWSALSGKRGEEIQN